MASPYYSPAQEHQPERPWMGLALLLSIPLLSLILIRMLWSGSGLWYLLIGIVFLAGAAALFWARSRDQYGATTLADEPNRLPLALMGIGLVFIVLLVLPNFSGGSSSVAPPSQVQNQSSQISSQAVTHPTAARAQPTVARQSNSASSSNSQSSTSSQVPLQPATDSTDTSTGNSSSPPAGSQTYVVQDGDTLWDIADRFSVSVDEIIAASNLANPADLQIGDELTIPPASADATSVDTTPAADSSTDATPTQ